MSRCLLVFAMSSMSLAADSAPLQPVPIQDVKIDDSFWSPRMKLWRETTVNDCLEKFDHVGAMSNFDHIARGELTVEHGGPPWYDGLIYQMLRAMGDFLAEAPDPAMEARADAMIDRISAAAAKSPDGYLNTYTQMKEPTHRWGQHGGNDRWQHDLYNAGTMVDAAVHYYRATGKTKLLETAVKLSNLMSHDMGPPPRANIIPGHAVGEEALIGLHQLFIEQPELKKKLSVPVSEADYLALAKFWIDARGHHEGRPDFGAYDQDHLPVLQQTTIEGHAVRAALFASGVTSLAMTTGDADYAKTALVLWKNMVERRLYLTGAVGSVAEDEKFGDDYSLPNNGYAETCAAVASAFFSKNINLATADAAAADEVERALYNGALAGTSMDGTTYFYENPLESGPNRLRWKWHDCPCCPPMFLKLMSALPGYIYATDSIGGVFVNQYIGSTAMLDVGDCGKIKIIQLSHFPWSGDVQLGIAPSKPTTFDLHVRIPSWVGGRDESKDALYSSVSNEQSPTLLITVNGEEVDSATLDHGYVKISREWKPGDTVNIRLPMTVARVHANANVQADQNRIALMRGPLVYCVESFDNGGAVRNLFVPNDATIDATQAKDLLGGVVTLNGTAQRRIDATRSEPAPFVAIPYFANANRGPVSMQVWIASERETARVESSSATSQPSSTTKPTWMPAGSR